MKNLTTLIPLSFVVLSACHTSNPNPNPTLKPDTRTEAPLMGPTLPIGGGYLGAFEMRTAGDRLYVGFVQERKAVLGRSLRIFELQKETWQHKLSLDVEWGELPVGFAIREDKIYFAKWSDHKLQLFEKSENESPTSLGAPLPTPDVGPATRDVDFDIDSRGRIYFGYFEGRTPHTYHLYLFEQGTWHDLTPTQSPVGLGGWPQKGSTRGLVLDGERAFIVGRDLLSHPNDQIPVVLELHPPTQTWQTVFSRPEIKNQGALQSFAFSSQSHQFVFGSIYQGYQNQFSAFYSKAPGAEWSVESESQEKVNTPDVSLVGLFASGLGGGTLVATVQKKTECATASARFRGGQMKLGNYVARGCPLDSTGSTGLHQNQILFAHWHPNLGPVLSNLGPADEISR